MIEMILIACVAIAAFFLVGKISGKVHLEKQIVYLVFGLVIGILLKQTQIGSVTQIFPNIDRYNMCALLFMFFTTGFTINLKQLKRFGSLTIKMFVLPAYLETIVMSCVLYVICRILPSLGFQLVFIETLIIAAIFSAASPANTITKCVDMIQNGYTGKNNIPGLMITASILDGFVTIPLVFSAAFILFSNEKGGESRLLMILAIVAVSLIGIIMSLILGMLVGRIILFFTRWVFKRLNNEKQSKYMNYFIILFVFATAVFAIYLLNHITIIKKIVTLFSILIMCGIGLSINKYDQTGVNQIIKRDGNKLFAIFGMPMIFMYVGASIELSVLANPKFLIFFSVVACCAAVVKGLAAKLVLKGEPYTKGERNFAAACFIPKGTALINFSVIFGALLNPESDMLLMMTTLGTVSVILTISIGMPLISKAKGKWIPKKI